MPNQVDDVLLHAMSDYELSRVRTELDQPRMVPAISLHPVQSNGKFLAMATLAILFSRRIISADTEAASLGYTVRPPALLPPAKSAVESCPAC